MHWDFQHMNAERTGASLAQTKASHPQIPLLGPRSAYMAKLTLVCLCEAGYCAVQLGVEQSVKSQFGNTLLISFTDVFFKIHAQCIQGGWRKLYKMVCKTCSSNCEYDLYCFPLVPLPPRQMCLVPKCESIKKRQCWINAAISQMMKIWLLL